MDKPAKPAKYGTYKCSFREHIERPAPGVWIFVNCTVQHGAATLWTLIESGKPERMFAISKDGIVEYNKGIRPAEITPGSIAAGPGLPSAKKAQEIIDSIVEAERWREITS